ncbi:hypothetical protein EDB82DRAFT_462387, partial [Fusarium venenatum]|uniref:uncharacterized protein n=1 Tax=Fusarium venenatum TaxID=56646 RepID=UPI001D7609B1
MQMQTRMISLSGTVSSLIATFSLPFHLISSHFTSGCMSYVTGLSACAWLGMYLGSSCLSMRRAPVGSETP